MRYRVHGVHRTMGTEISQTFEADSEEFAALMASATMLVASVRPEGDLPQGIPIGSVLPYQNRSDAKVGSAPYGSLQTGVWMLRALSIVLYVAAGVGLIGTLVAFGNGAVAVGLTVGGVTVACVLIAVTSTVFAGIGEAVRDMAIMAARSAPPRQNRPPENSRSE